MQMALKALSIVEALASKRNPSQTYQHSQSTSSKVLVDLDHFLDNVYV